MAFSTAYKITRIEEGGLSDHPDDKGGRTKWGITQENYNAYRKLKGKATQDVDLATEEEASDFFYSQYWETSGCERIDKISVAIAILVYDFAVNSGPSRAARYLQECLGVLADGVVGNGTLDAIKEICEQPGAEAAFVHEYMNARRTFGRGLKGKSGYKTFGAGWEKRWNRVERKAIQAGQLRAVKPVPQAAPVKEPNAQARESGKAIPDQPSTTGFDVGNAVTQAGSAIAIGTQAAEAAQGARTIGETLIAVGPWVLLAIVIAGVGFYFWRQHRQKIKETLL